MANDFELCDKYLSIFEFEFLASFLALSFFPPNHLDYFKKVKLPAFYDY